MNVSVIVYRYTKMARLATSRKMWPCLYQQVDHESDDDDDDDDDEIEEVIYCDGVVERYMFDSRC